MSTTAQDDPTVEAGGSSTGPALRRGLSNRHIQMIALGGAIGTGLFYGSGQSIGLAGPAITLVYLVGGMVIFLIMRALGEMSWHNPVSGAFSQYAYENWGKFPGFVSGWNYWFNYIAVAMAELSVVGIYFHFWWPGIPAWMTAAFFLVVITCMNLISVKAFGEFEFWFAIVKVVAIIAMIALGLSMIVFGVGNDGQATGMSNLWDNGGFMPEGVWGCITALVVVMFSFGGVELIGITAGEADNPRKTIPKAINQVVYRILIFYVGAIFVMLCIFPWNELAEGEGSPFVTVFDRIGIVGAASIMNIVVITALISAYNSCLYSNGRMLFGLAQQGNAPKIFTRVNSKGSPFVGVLASTGVTAIAVVMAFLWPDEVFKQLMSIALIAGIINWTMVIITQMKFRKRIGRTEVEKLGFKMPFFPVTNYIVLAFLAGVVVLMVTMDDYRHAVVVGPVWLAVLGVAFWIKGRVAARAEGASTSGD